MTKDECKDKIAKQEGYGDWADLWGAMQQKFNGVRLFARMNSLENRAMDEFAQIQVNNLDKAEVINRRELLFAFIKDWKEEFKDENWDYLDFKVERFLSKQQLLTVGNMKSAKLKEQNYQLKTNIQVGTTPSICYIHCQGAFIFIK